MRSIPLLVALALFGCGRPPAPASVPRPNLILIIGDDHGYRDFGFMDSPHVKTPHLDRLAREGTLFTLGFTTASICRPSLRSLLTGLYPHQWDARVEQLRGRGIRRVPTQQIGDFRTLPGLLAERGYASFQGGKYWEASYELGGFTHGMLEPGDSPHWGGSSRLLGRTSMAPLTEFMDAHLEQPFFVWFAPMLPHVPHDPGAAYRKLYEDADLSEAARGYYGNITRLDDRIGELVAYLDRNGLRERTLLVYLSDNGWDQGPRAQRNGMWDGPRGKSSMYEVGFRTPILLNWPGHVPAGAVHELLVSTVDLFPTLLDYAGLGAPADRPGHSLRPLIEGSGEWGRDVVIGGMSRSRPSAREAPGEKPDRGREGEAYFLRTPRWRYIWFVERGSHELYDMRSDPDETEDVVERNPALAAIFRGRIERWRAETRRSSLARSPAPPRRRNLVLISIDTLVPGRMSAYGGERGTTPAIASLAARGARFERAYSPSPWTLPAHATMLTGRYPSSMSADPNDSRMFHGAPLLSELFRRAGYRTGAVTGGGYVSPRFGADRGFETFEWSGPPRAIRFIETHRDESFFLFFHTYAAHVPYEDRRFAEGMGGGRLDAIYTDGAKALHREVCCRSVEPTDAERAFLLALYDGGVARADEMVGTLVSALERRDLLDRTTVIVTSDHGEEFWEHTGRAAYHGHTLYDELLRIPLVWYEPDLVAPGRRIDVPVHLIDLVPTIVARFGLDPVATDGLDLSPLLDAQAWDVERPLFGEGVAHGPSRLAVLSARGKLIETPDPAAQRGEGAWFPVPVRAARELYRAGDVGERHNVIDRAPALRAKLEAALRAHRARAAARTLSSELGELELDAPTRERLRSLGYAE